MFNDLLTLLIAYFIESDLAQQSVLWKPFIVILILIVVNTDHFEK